MSLKKIKIAILGAGAFGTALAISYSKYFDVTLFSGFQDHVDELKKTRINKFLEEFKLPKNIEIDLVQNINGQTFDYIFWVFPLGPTPQLLSSLKNQIQNSKIVICSKGLLPDSSFLSDLFKKFLPQSEIAYLAGPNFASEIAGYKISVADLVSDSKNTAIKFCEDLSNDLLRLTPLDDIIGSQLCGALKNIIAIACGIVKGLSLGDNFHAALITQALYEIKTFLKAVGAQEKTVYGYSGLGDLILTVSSESSRNMSFGKKIGQNNNINEILLSQVAVCEGYNTLKQVIKLASEKNVKLSICEMVANIVFNKKNPREIINVIR